MWLWILYFQTATCGDNSIHGCFHSLEVSDSKQKKANKMYFYGLYKLLPKLVLFWSAKWMQALSGTSYSVFSPWCLFTSFSTLLCSMSLALAFPSSQKSMYLFSPLWKHTLNLLASTTAISPPFSLSSVSMLRVLFTFANWSSSLTWWRWAACCNSTATAHDNFSIDFSSNGSQRLHPFLTCLIYWLQGTNSTAFSVLKFKSLFKIQT